MADTVDTQNSFTHKYPTMAELHAQSFGTEECIYCEGLKVEGSKYCTRHLRQAKTMNLEQKLRCQKAMLMIKTIAMAGRR